ncbi:MAG: hypothetical protein IJY39_04690 [Clostridia bacterium]|nr:hypothetical protein [Clostridia bacterium]
MIITVVFLIILAFFIALFSIRIRVTIEMKDELSLSVLAFGIKIKILPKKPKKYNIKNYTPKKIAKRDQAAAVKAAKAAEKKAEKKAKKEAEKQRKKEEQQKLTKAEKKAIKAKKKASRPPIPDMLSLFLRVIKLFFSGFFSKFHFHVARIRIKIGSADAATTAMMWCAISTGLKPILMLIDKKSNLHGMKNADINIMTDYLSEEIEADVKLAFSLSIGGLLGVLFRTAFSFLFGWLKIKPSTPAGEKDDSKKSANDKKSQKDTAIVSTPAQPQTEC